MLLFASAVLLGLLGLLGQGETAGVQVLHNTDISCCDMAARPTAQNLEGCIELCQAAPGKRTECSRMNRGSLAVSETEWLLARAQFPAIHKTLQSVFVITLRRCVCPHPLPFQAALRCRGTGPTRSSTTTSAISNAMPPKNLSFLTREKLQRSFIPARMRAAPRRRRRRRNSLGGTHPGGLQGMRTARSSTRLRATTLHKSEMGMWHSLCKPGVSLSLGSSPASSPTVPPATEHPSPLC